jgi:small subunit ribosomal protein S3Ae
MGMKNKPRTKEEAAPEEKKSAKLEQEATPEQVDEKILVKKWKGKDWFNILAPRELGAKVLGQSPATDPKTLMGRTMEVGVPEITGDNSKYYMKLYVKITATEGKTCLTSFNGLECTRDHLLRMVRKRNQKVESIVDVATKDGWILRIKPWAILNGKPPSTVETKVRNLVAKFFNDFASNNNMSDVVRKAMTTEMQMMLKKSGSKIYPIRFSEIARIKVLKSPEFHAARPVAAEAVEAMEVSAPVEAEPAVSEAEEKPVEAAQKKEKKKAAKKEKAAKSEAKESKKKPDAE